MTPTGAEATVKAEVKMKDSEDPPTGISKKLWSMLEEQKSSIRNLISENQEVQSSLLNYHEELTGWRSQHLQLQDRLYGLMEQNMTALESLEQEDIKVSDRLVEGKEVQQDLQTTLESLDAASTRKEMVSLVDEADEQNIQAEDWNKRCREHFPDTNVVDKSVKVCCLL